MGEIRNIILGCAEQPMEKKDGGWVSKDGHFRAAMDADGKHLHVASPSGQAIWEIPDGTVDVYVPPSTSNNMDMGVFQVFPVSDPKSLASYTQKICTRSDDVGAMILPLSIQSTPRELKDGDNKVRLQIVIQDASGRPSRVTYGDGRKINVQIDQREPGQFFALLTLFQSPDNINSSFPNVIIANNVPVSRLPNGAFRLVNLPFRKVSAGQYEFAGEIFAAPPVKRTDPELAQHRNELKKLLEKPEATDAELQTKLAELKQLAVKYRADLDVIPSPPNAPEPPIAKIIRLARLAQETGSTLEKKIAEKAAKARGQTPQPTPTGLTEEQKKELAPYRTDIAALFDTSEQPDDKALYAKLTTLKRLAEETGKTLADVVEEKLVKKHRETLLNTTVANLSKAFQASPLKSQATVATEGKRITIGFTGIDGIQNWKAIAPLLAKTLLAEKSLLVQDVRAGIDFRVLLDAPETTPGQRDSIDEAFHTACDTIVPGFNIYLHITYAQPPKVSGPAPVSDEELKPFYRDLVALTDQRDKPADQIDAGLMRNQLAALKKTAQTHSEDLTVIPSPPGVTESHLAKTVRLARLAQETGSTVEKKITEKAEKARAAENQDSEFDQTLPKLQEITTKSDIPSNKTLYSQLQAEAQKTHRPYLVLLDEKLAAVRKFRAANATEIFWGAIAIIDAEDLHLTALSITSDVNNVTMAMGKPTVSWEDTAKSLETFLRTKTTNLGRAVGGFQGTLTILIDPLYGSPYGVEKLFDGAWRKVIGDVPAARLVVAPLPTKDLPRTIYAKELNIILTTRGKTRPTDNDRQELVNELEKQAAAATDIPNAKSNFLDVLNEAVEKAQKPKPVEPKVNKPEPKPVPVDPEVQKYRNVLIKLTDQQGKSEDQIDNALLKAKLDALKALLPRYGEELQLLRSAVLKEMPMDTLLRFALIAKDKGKELEALLTASAMEAYNAQQGSVVQQINARFEPLIKMPGSIGATKFLATATDNGVEIEVTAASWTGSTIPQKIVEVLGRVTGIAQYEGKFTITLRGKATEAEQQIAAAAFIGALGKIIPALKDSKAVDARIKFAVFQSDIQSPTPQGVTREALVGLLGAYNLENAVNLAGLGAEAVPHVPVTMNGFSLPWITLKDPGTTGGREILFQKLTEHIYSVAQQRKIRPGELQVLIVPHRLAANAYASLEKAADILNDRPAGPETCLHTVSTLRPKYVFIKSNDIMRSYLDDTISVFIVPTKAIELDTGTDQQADIKNAEAVFLALTNRLGLTRAQEVDMGGGKITYTPAPAKELQPGYRPEPVEPKQPVIPEPAPKALTTTELTQAFSKGLSAHPTTDADRPKGIQFPSTGATSFFVDFRLSEDSAYGDDAKIKQLDEELRNGTGNAARQAAQFIAQRFPQAYGVIIYYHPAAQHAGLSRKTMTAFAKRVFKHEHSTPTVDIRSTNFLSNQKLQLNKKNNTRLDTAVRLEFVVIHQSPTAAETMKTIMRQYALRAGGNDNSR